MDSQDPWHLTVVRTRGLTFLRPEKSWRPIVSVSIVDRNRDHGLPHEVVLGCDGQNPNLRSGISISDVSLTTKLDVQVFHKSQTKKKHRKRNLVGSASVSLNEFLRKHPLPHPRPVEYDVRLSCPPPQHKSATIWAKQQHSATLTMRFVVPHREPPRSHESRPITPMTEHYETEPLLSDAPSSSRGLSETLVSNTPDERTDEMPWGKQPESDRLDGIVGLRRRRKKPKMRGFHVDSDSHAETSSGEESCYPKTPETEYFPPIYEDESGLKFREEGEGEVAAIFPRILPQHAGQGSVVSAQTSLSFMERCLYWISPYEELKEADAEGDCEKAEKVLGRMLTEWYVVGASLLALAGINAAVFGLAPGSLFVLDGFSLGSISIGAIAAGLGLVYDAWFLVLYSGASGAKFLRLAKDVYNKYIFFCLTCRLPMFCMAISIFSLMLFLLAVAWTAWPTAVLVMSFVAGFLLTSQFVIFGIHRLINLVVWVIRVSWRTVMTRRSSSMPSAYPEAQLGPQTSSGERERHRERERERGWEREPRIEMPIPCPSPAPVVASPEHLTAHPKMQMIWVDDRVGEHEGPGPS
ncbi:hypothetical protein DICSQDRAFT_165322 [Dichomitus squalens LYAD-421 SS1]|uniref:uncharacterized protein n=1 Tax=Dichomitus squalens (strain LYAD-421) TaxID=732165 RepID=UPI0004416026|nr:uncharacterized protein DICSQDRAFT_165322 [Dichomitus squalens LYAD-421 SS1]EJF67498.1 hypothetical protein DICSQDRAFT_165322 [Dichomitus squalens LYAD-421 SS1]